MEDLHDKLMAVCPTQSDAAAAHYLYSIVFDKHMQVATSFYAGEAFDKKLKYLKLAGISQAEVDHLEYAAGRKPRPLHGLYKTHTQQEL